MRGKTKKVPASETVPYHFRTAPYIKREKQKPEDLSKWDEDLDPDYVMEQAQAMLMQLGYKEADGERGTMGFYKSGFYEWKGRRTDP